MTTAALPMLHDYPFLCLWGVIMQHGSTLKDELATYIYLSLSSLGPHSAWQGAGVLFLNEWMCASLIGKEVRSSSVLFSSQFCHCVSHTVNMQLMPVDESVVTLTGSNIPRMRPGGEEDTFSYAVVPGRKLPSWARHVLCWLIPFFHCYLLLHENQDLLKPDVLFILPPSPGVIF